MGTLIELRPGSYPAPAPTGRSAHGRVWRTALGWVVLGLVVVAWAATLRPVTLGGPATYVVVRGTSMEPTLHAGDAVLTRRQPTYDVGDVIAYRPRGTDAVVIHRVVRIDGDRYITRGDNRPSDDPWRPRGRAVAGRRVATAPRAGTLLWWIGAHPVALAALGGVSTALVIIGWPVRRRDTAGGIRPHTPPEGSGPTPRLRDQAPHPA